MRKSSPHPVLVAVLPVICPHACTLRPRLYSCHYSWPRTHPPHQSQHGREVRPWPEPLGLRPAREARGPDTLKGRNGRTDSKWKTCIERNRQSHPQSLTSFRSYFHCYQKCQVPICGREIAQFVKSPWKRRIQPRVSIVPAESMSGRASLAQLFSLEPLPHTALRSCSSSIPVPETGWPVPETDRIAR